MAHRASAAPRLLFGAVLALQLAAPAVAHAYCVRNDLSETAHATIFAEGYDSNIGSGLTDCRTSGRGSAETHVRIETEKFVCAVRMPANGSAAILTEDRSRWGLPLNYFCASYDASGAQYDISNYGINAAKRDVRFLATADPQYDSNPKPAKNDNASAVLARMFSTLGGDRRIRGVVIAGDLTQNARIYDQIPAYWAAIAGAQEFVFDGLGNHDLEKSSAIDCFFNPGSCADRDVLRADVRDRKRATRPTKVGDPHYSWDWHDVHFVQLNVFAGDTTAPGRDESPMGALTFLQQDLRDNVGLSGRPVVLVQHYGFDAFSTGHNNALPGKEEVWWTDAQRLALWDALAPYNVIAVIGGHVHLAPGDPSWERQFERPSNRTTGPASIPQYVAGAACEGTYIDVTIDDDWLSARQYDKFGALQQTSKRVPLRNLALGGHATQSSDAFATQGQADRAIDGNSSGDWAVGSVTHTNAEEYPWWAVDLGSVKRVGDVVIFNRTDCCTDRLSNFTVLASENGTSWREQKFPGMAGVETTIAVNGAARYIAIRLDNPGAPRPLSLAEVKVYEQRSDVQISKVTQSTDAFVGIGGAGAAIDGNTNGDFWAGSVTHTSDELSPYWQVQLKDWAFVEDLVLFNRTDCCGERLSNFSVLSSTDGTHWSPVAVFPGTAGATTTIHVGQSLLWLRVQLNNTGTPRPLSLAEAKIYASNALIYGENYHVLNEYGSFGGYLDVRNLGCEGNLLCVSTAPGPDRDGWSDRWQILSAEGKEAGTPVMAGDKVYLRSWYANGGYNLSEGGYLDIRATGCEGNAYCVSTSIARNRDSDSGIWKVVTDDGQTGPLYPGQSLHLQNGFGTFQGGYLDTRGAGCEGNFLCVSTSSTWDRDNRSTHWRFERLP